LEFDQESKIHPNIRHPAKEFMDNLKDATSGTGIVIPLGTPDLTPCF